MKLSIRWRPWVRWFFPRLFVAATLYLGGYTALNALLSARLSARMEAIRARGEPFGPSDLAQPEVPSERDAGPYFRSACALMEGLEPATRDVLGTYELDVRDRDEDGDPSFAWVDEELRPRSTVAVDDWLRGEPALEALLAELGRRPECRSTVAFDEDGPFTLLPHLGPAKELARLSLAAANGAAERGDAARATRLQALGYSLAKCLYADRYCLISALVAEAVEGMAHDNLQLVMSRGGLGEAELDRIDATLAGMPDMPAVYRDALIGERSGFGVFWFQAMIEGQSVSQAGKFSEATGILRLWLLADFDLYLDVLDQAIAVPWNEEDPSLDFKEFPSYSYVAYLLMPAMGKFRERLQRAEQFRVLGRCALALERERLERGRYPEELEARFARAGVRYERSGEGFLLTAPHAEDAAPRDVVSFRVKR